MLQFSVPGDSLRTRVLLLDSNADFVEVAAEFLRRHYGLVIVGAFLGYADLLTMVQELQPQVILVDLDTRGSLGLETIPCLRDTLPGAGIIALTLSNSSAYHQAALAAGADDLICKADLTRDLLPAIEQLTPTLHLLQGAAERMPLAG